MVVSSSSAVGRTSIPPRFFYAYEMRASLKAASTEHVPHMAPQTRVMPVGAISIKAFFKIPSYSMGGLMPIPVRVASTRLIRSALLASRRVG